MTETRTTKFELPQYSAGTDGPSRADWNEAFIHLEGRAAYDDGAPVSTLPTTGLYAARYFWQVQQPGGGANPTYRTLWRSDGTTLYSVGGPTITTTQLYRGLHSSVSGTVTADAVRVEHPTISDLGGWSANVTYAGAGFLRTGLALGSSADDTLGRLAVGGSAIPASTARLTVDSYATGEHAIVARGHHATPGNLFRGLDTSGSAAFVVDGVGRLTASKPSAFGGASLPTTAALAVAPTSGPGLFANGLLLYGLTAAGDAGDVDKSILKAQLDLADTDPIVTLNRLNMKFGRIAWGTPGVVDSGTLRFDANSFTFRTTGSATGAGRAYLHFRRSNPAAENDTTQDTLLFSVNPTGIISDLPATVTQRASQAATTLNLARVGNFSSSFLEAYRLVPDGLGGETTQPASSLLSDGRLRVGAWWRGTGTMRDARQSLHHRSTKIWAAPGGIATDGTAITTGNSFTYTFGSMTVRSVDVADLIIKLAVELQLNATAVDGQLYSFQCLVSINGGTYTAVPVDALQENVSIATNSPGQRAVGELFNVSFIKENVAAGSTFQVRFRAVNGSSAPTLYLRKYVLDVEEALIEDYVAP